MPVIFITAHAPFTSPVSRKRLQKGGTVPVQYASRGLGAVAEIDAIVDAKETTQALNEVGIAQDHNFNSHELSIPTGILAATNGSGIDAIVCSATVESWIAPMGCFVGLGRTKYPRSNAIPSSLHPTLA